MLLPVLSQGWSRVGIFIAFYQPGLWMQKELPWEIKYSLQMYGIFSQNMSQRKILKVYKTSKSSSVIPWLTLIYIYISTFMF